MFGAWTTIAALLVGGAPMAATPALELRSPPDLRFEDRLSPRAVLETPHGPFERAVFDETLGPERLGPTGAIARPKVDAVITAFVDVVLDERLRLPTLGRIVGTLAGCDLLAVALSRAFAHEDDLRKICDDIVLDLTLDLVGSTAQLMDEGEIVGDVLSDPWSSGVTF